MQFGLRQERPRSLPQQISTFECDLAIIVVGKAVLALPRLRYAAVCAAVQTLGLAAEHRDDELARSSVSFSPHSSR